ncbi:hypothetical protein BH20ACT6_BH20ACT6_24060 [soil metagenome]
MTAVTNLAHAVGISVRAAPFAALVAGGLLPRQWAPASPPDRDARGEPVRL